jgi:hypothetical protein
MRSWKGARNWSFSLYSLFFRSSSSASLAAFYKSSSDVVFSWEDSDSPTSSSGISGSYLPGLLPESCSTWEPSSSLGARDYLDGVCCLECLTLKGDSWRVSSLLSDFFVNLGVSTDESPVGSLLQRY